MSGSAIPPTETAFFNLHFKKSRRYSPIRALDPALHARLKSAQQRPDKNPSTRAKIETALGRKNDTQ
jgi:hypothetical protein